MPLLSLGIPGDSTTAVLIGAFMLQSIPGGPVHHQQSGDLNTILVALLCCNILMYLVMFFSELLAKIVLIPRSACTPWCS